MRPNSLSLLAGGPGFEPGLTESESAMSAVRILVPGAAQTDPPRTNNCQWHLVSAASVSWRAILRASADERARDKMTAWISCSAIFVFSRTFRRDLKVRVGRRFGL